MRVVNLVLLIFLIICESFEQQQGVRRRIKKKIPRVSSEISVVEKDNDEPVESSENKVREQVDKSSLEKEKSGRG